MEAFTFDHTEKILLVATGILFITHTLSTQGVSYTIVDPRNFEQVEAAIQDNTKALYAETFGAFRIHHWLRCSFRCS